MHNNFYAIIYKILQKYKVYSIFSLFDLDNIFGSFHILTIFLQNSLKNQNDVKKAYQKLEQKAEILISLRKIGKL